MQEKVIEGYEIAPQQRFLWLRQEEGSGERQAGQPYVTQAGISIVGSLAPAVLTKALNEIVSRHEILRTNFHQLSGMSLPVQVISDKTVSLEPVHDFSEHSSEEQEAQIQDLLRAAGNQPFDWENGQLLRTALVKLQEQRHLLLLTLPALCADRNSMAVLVEKLAAAYQACHGDTPFEDETTQYADFAAWHIDLLKSEDNQTGYWKERLQAAALDRPLGKRGGPSEEARVFEPKLLSQKVEAGLSSRLNELAAAQKVPVETVLEAAWRLLLWRLCDKAQMTVGVAHGGRTYQGLERAVGLFEKFLPGHCALEAGTAFSDFLNRLHQLNREMNSHQEYFHSQQVGEQAGQHQIAYCFEYQPNQDTTASAGGLSFSLHSSSSCTAPFGLKLVCRPEGDHLDTQLHFDGGSFAEAEVSPILSQLHKLLESLVAAPEETVDRLDILPDEQRQQLLGPFANGPERELEPRCFHQQFELQAARVPEKLAVEFKDVQWSYGELNQRANRWAHHLISLGVGPGVPVPIFARRSPEMLLGLLAIAKAGGAFVALDSNYPRERLTGMLAEIGSNLILTTQEIKGLLPPTQSQVLLLDDPDTTSSRSSENPTVQVAFDGLAYIIYTSGTTGAPNGVMISHRGLANYLNWAVETYEMKSGEGSLVHSSIAYDLTITSLFGPLTVGQPMKILAEDAGVRAVAVALRSGKRYSFVKLTPTHLRAINQMFPLEEAIVSLHCLVMGGEDLRREALSFAKEHTANTRFFNEYGPTETVVGSTAYEIPMAESTVGRVPIGRPIANTQVYLLDPHLEPVPVGVAGEIYIGGHGVAKGYFNRPDLTAQKFIRSPFSDDPKARLYKTGDLGRYLPEGNLEYLGRDDHQVKIRGFRIELKEIETTLGEHPGIMENVVLAVDRKPDGKKLIAFVVPHAGGQDQSLAKASQGAWRPKKRKIILSTAELHGFLRDRLPDYMVPSAFVLMDKLPLTHSGKVDYARLSHDDAGFLELGTPYVEPTTEEEKILAEVWSKVLGIDRVGIDDNYFAVGGDSIRSINISGEAVARGLSLSVGDVHKFPTIRDMAAQLKAKHTAAVDLPPTSPFSMISDEDRAKVPPEVEDAYPLVLLQEGMIYHRAFAAKSAVYHAMLALRLRTPFNLEAMQEAVQALVNRHPLMRTAFDLKTFSRPLQMVFRDFKDPLQYFDLRHLDRETQKKEVNQWVLEEKKRGFEVDEFPLIRFIIHRYTEDTYELTFSYHHEIIDGWSEATMVSELLDHYFSILSGNPVEPVAPTANFRDSVLLEQKALESKAFQDFWAKEIENANLMRMPRLKGGPKADKGQRDIIKLARPFPLELSDKLKRLSLATKTPIKSVLLAAHMRVMSHFSGHKDVLTHMVSNGRPETPGGDGVIGLFVNSFTHRQKLPGGSWRNLIQETFKREQETWPWRRFPMAELKRHQGRDPLSETLYFFIDYHIYHLLEKWEEAELLELNFYGESTFPLCCTFRANPFTSYLEMQVEYDALSFTAQLMEDMIASYFIVLEEMTRNVDGLYQNKVLLSEREKDLILKQWNDTEKPYSQDRCIHHLIDEQARSKATAKAVIYGQQSLDYESFVSRSNQLANLLRSHKVVTETPVAICMERSLEMAVAILGVLKAGGTYVPLDPGHRKQRLTSIMSDSGARLIVTQPNLTDALPEHNAEVLVLDATWSALEGQADKAPETGVHPDNAAYRIYTSGSTGKPKGVVVTHHNLVNSTEARRHYYEAPMERFLLLSSFAFDSSMVGIFWSWCQGGTLVLPDEGFQLEPNSLVKMIDHHRITHTLAIPSLYGSLLELLEEGQCASLKTMIVAGETCPKEIFETHAKKLPHVEFHNEYGPTEATVWSSVWKGEPLGWKTKLPIGKPVANTQVYLLDEFGLPVPIGVQAEVHVGGTGLARGYAGDPAQTAEKFIPNPFSGKPGDRLYRTGDLGRFTSDGQLEFLNRLDYQVKVRGFRIEPIEIETVLDAHPEVQRSAVLAREMNGDKMLVAYILPQDKAPKVGDLQQHVKGALPKYMYPAHYVIMEAMPMTSTGKLDRKALPKPDASRPDLESNYVAPRTPTEELLAGIWSEVLGVEKVGMHDDFFDLGGESLRGMRILSKVSKTFNVQLPVGTLFEERPTIAELAEVVEASRWQSGTSGKEATENLEEGDL